MPKNKDKTDALLQQINALEISPANLYKTSLNTWKIYAAQSAFALLYEISDTHNFDFRVLKKLFEKYQATEEYIKIQEEIKTISDYTKSNPEFKVLFNDASDLDEQDIQKMAAALELESLFVDLKQKKYSFQLNTAQEIFVLMNAILPYYPEDRRNSWNLASLFKSCEKMHGLYFHILNQIVSLNIDLPLFNQMQSTYLCAMMMWMSSTESLNLKLIRHAFSALDECKHLPNLIDLVFNNALAGKINFIEPEGDEAIFMLPSPLNMIDILCNNDNPPNHPFNKLKEKFLLLHKIPLHLSLTMEFTNFLDKILDFAKDTATPQERTIILKNAAPYRYIIDLLNKTYLDAEKWPILVSNKPAFIIIICSKLIDLMNKWALVIQKNQSDHAKASRTAKKLIKENEIEKIQETKELAVKLAEWQKQKKEQAAQEFNERKIKKTKEEQVLETKQEERLKQSQLSILEQAQEKISNLLGIENPETKELRMIQTINELLDSKDLSLEAIKETTLSPAFYPYNIYPLLLLYINLFEHFTIQIEKNLHTYQKEYGQTITIMKDKYGLDENGQLLPFSGTDYDNNSYIKCSLNKISMHINNMLSDFKKAKDLLPILEYLKTKVSDEPSFEALCKAENFIKDVYNYEKIPMQLELLIKTLGEYKTNKNSICKFLPSNPNQDIAKKNEEKKAYQQIDKLITDFQEEISKFNKIKFSADLTKAACSTSQFFKQESNPKTPVERRDRILAALYQLDDHENTKDFKKEILSKIKGDQIIDDEEFWKLFNSIQARISSIPAMTR